MKIPDQLLKEWKKLKQFGDPTKIIEANPSLLEKWESKSIQNKIYSAFNGADTDIEIVAALKAFYADRQKQIDAVLK